MHSLPEEKTRQVSWLTLFTGAFPSPPEEQWLNAGKHHNGLTVARQLTIFT